MLGLNKIPQNKKSIILNDLFNFNFNLMVNWKSLLNDSISVYHLPQRASHICIWHHVQFALYVTAHAVTLGNCGKEKLLHGGRNLGRNQALWGEPILLRVGGDLLLLLATRRAHRPFTGRGLVVHPLDTYLVTHRWTLTLSHRAAPANGFSKWP